MSHPIDEYSHVVVAFADRKKIIERRNNDVERVEHSPMSFGERLFSHLSEWWQKDKTYTHCEIAFLPKNMNGNSLCLTYGVFSNRSSEAVVKMRRCFNNIYKLKTISIDRSSMIKMYDFLESQLKKNFDYYGSMMGTIWSGKFDYKREKWYCLSLTVAALQKGGLLYGIRPNCIEIDELYSILLELDNVNSAWSPFEHRTVEKFVEDLKKPKMQSK